MLAVGVLFIVDWFVCVVCRDSYCLYQCVYAFMGSAFAGLRVGGEGALMHS